MKNLSLVLVCLSLVFLTACIGSAPVEGMKSPIGANWKAPMNTNVNNITLGTKVGRASVKAYAFGLYSAGDMSVATAAANGGIKTIRHMDYEYTNAFFFAYQEMTTIVYGD
jgi:hypothetical protein